MALILDTNALSAIADADSGIYNLIESETDLLVPLVAWGEYLFGIRQSRYRARHEQWLSESRSAFTLLGMDDETASAYADIRIALKRAGTPIPRNDLWIAASAIQYGLPVITRDSHFRRVAGLQVLTW